MHFDVGTLSLLVVNTITVAAVPVTHGYVGHRLHKDACNSWRFKNFSSGGTRFQVFQGLSWSFFAASLMCVALGVTFYFGKMRLMREDLFAKTRVTREDLFGASICSALISEVLMVSSLFTYHRGQQPRRRHRRLPSMSSVYLSSTGEGVLRTNRRSVVNCRALLSSSKYLWLAFRSKLGFTEISFTHESSCPYTLEPPSSRRCVDCWLLPDQLLSSQRITCTRHPPRDSSSRHSLWRALPLQCR